jgi:hypothetical protein
MGWTTLKSSVFVSQFEDGVVFRGGKAPVIFRGKRARDLVRALVTLMEQKMTCAAMVARFPGAAQPVAERLLDDLEQHHMLRERDEDDPEPLPQAHFRFRNLWNYLADHLTRPGEALIRWQKTAFCLSGSVEASLYTVRALAECAALRIVLVAPGFTEEQASILDRLRAEFEGLMVEVVSTGTTSTPDPTIEETSALVRIFSAGDNEFSTPDYDVSHAWYFGLLSGHLVTAFLDGSVAGLLPQWSSRMRPALPAGETGRLSEQRVALAAASTAFAAFNRHTGIEWPTDPSTLRIVELTSQITPITLPDAPSIHPVARLVDTEAVGAISPETDAQMAMADILFDPIGGILEDEPEIDAIQVPLSVVPLRVYAHDRSAPPIRVYGWGYSPGEARRRAIQRAVRSHLLTVPVIAECALAVAVEWSAYRSETVALSASTMSRVQAAGIQGEPLPMEMLTQPEVRKLVKLVSLLTSTEPVLTVWRWSEPPCVRVQVKLHGQSIGDACASSVSAAAYEALGDACMTVQLPELSLTRKTQPVLAKFSKADSTPELQIKRIDLGYTALRDHLYCTMIQNGGSSC